MAASDIKQDHDSVLIDQVPESVNSPANSDTSSSSSNSSLSSSTASDINDLENGAAEENISLQEVDNDDEDEKNDATASPPQNLIPSHRDLNGIVTFNTSPIHSSSIASPPSSDPEEDLHDLHGDENDIQASSIDEYAPEARVHSLTNPSSRITAVMQSSSAVLWKQFDALGTEMIVTRRGRYVMQPLWTCACVCVCLHMFRWYNNLIVEIAWCTPHMHGSVQVQNRYFFACGGTTTC